MTFNSNNELDREFVRGLLREIAKRTPEPPPHHGWSATELEQYVIDDDEGGFPHWYHNPKA